MNDRVAAWHVLLAGPVVGFLAGVGMVLVSPLARDAGVGNGAAVALALHGSVVVVVAVVAAVAAIVPLVLLAFGRLRRLGVALSALLSVGFGVLPPEPHPATWGAVLVFALVAVLGLQETLQVDVDEPEDGARDFDGAANDETTAEEAAKDETANDETEDDEAVNDEKANDEPVKEETADDEAGERRVTGG